MSAFMVFGVSYSSLRSVAEGCVKRQILTKKKLDRSYEMTQDEYVAAVNEKQKELWQKKRKPKPVSAPFGSPHPCRDYIEVAGKSGQFKDMQIMVRGDLKKDQEKWIPYTITR